MAYFHEFSLSLFISLSSSPSSSFVVEESFWDRLALHSIFESLFSCLFPKKMFVCVCVCVFVDDVNILYFFSFSYFFRALYRNSGTGEERQSAARKAKSDCLGSKPDLTIPVRLTSITKPDRSVSNVFCCPARQINPDQCLFRNS